MTREAWDHGGKTRQQRGYGREHERMRDELLRTVILCEECTRNGRTTPGTHADHIVPKAKGGTDERSNYQLLCASCHALKSIHDQGKNPRLRKRRVIALDGWPIDD
ncbi:HNH endonuclease [Sphingosinicella sp. LY1275]|uniref:HNH endonuclease n=1 Tax=Sphingosinicella sp. LY1275 TaxID=3095379 RepID=UPI002ADEA72D|nr:HNH endonuclease [Sphingosinicella sp. LY1275]MEA1015597.1 HNH endonuclease [Sphingosinicella sp. LY1275]